MNDPSAGRVSIQLRSGSAEEIFSFGSLEPVRLAWSHDGSIVAFSHSTLCCIRPVAGSVRIARLPAVVSWIGFDAAGCCWCRAGTSLYALAAGDDRAPRVRREGVVAVDAGSAGVVAVVATGGLLQVELVDAPGRSLPWPLPFRARPRVRFAHDAATLLLSGEAARERGRTRMRIDALDMVTGAVKTLVEAEIGVGISAPALHWEPWCDGGALALYESGARASLRTCAAERVPERIGPEWLEAYAFAGSPARRVACLIGSDTRTAEGATQRGLFVARHSGASWRCEQVAWGVNDLVAWTADGRVLHTHAETGERRWRLQVVPSGADGSEPPARRARSRVWSRQVARRPAEVLAIGAAARADAGVLYVQGPHRQFLDGPQPWFFHQALACVVHELAERGYAVAAINGPGALGRGRGRREAGGRAYLDEAVEAAASGVAFLRERGCQAVALLGGSLAAFAVLRFLQARDDIAAAALVSPMCSLDVPELAEWSWLFGDQRLPETLDLAPRIAAPLLVVHGLADEISPPGYWRSFLSRLPREGASRLVALPDEGHVYHRLGSWRQAAAEAHAFLAEHLDRSTGSVR